MTGMGKPGDQQTWVYQKTPDSWAAGSTGGGSSGSAGLITGGFKQANYSMATSSVAWNIPVGSTFVGEPNLTASITTTGSPVFIQACANYVAQTNNSQGIFSLTRNGVNLGHPVWGMQAAGPLAQSYNNNVSYWYVDFPPAGTYTYSFVGCNPTGSGMLTAYGVGPAGLMLWEMVGANVVTGSSMSQQATGQNPIPFLSASINPAKNPVLAIVSCNYNNDGAQNWAHAGILRNGSNFTNGTDLVLDVAGNATQEYMNFSMLALDVSPNFGASNTYTVTTTNGAGSGVLSRGGQFATIILWELSDVNYKYGATGNNVALGGSYTDVIQSNPVLTLITRGRPVLLLSNIQINTSATTGRSGWSFLRNSGAISPFAKGFQLVDGEGFNDWNRVPTYGWLDVQPAGSYQYIDAGYNVSGSQFTAQSPASWTTFFMYELDAGVKTGILAGGWLDTGGHLSTTSSVDIGGPLTIGGLPYIIPSGSVTVNTGSFGQVIIGYTPPVSGSSVNTDETQGAGAAYGDLATVGPSVTLNTSGSVLINVCATAYKTSGAGNTAFISPQVSGASTVAAADTNASEGAATGAGTFCLSRTFVMTGLTPGLNTFTLKYKNDGGTTWHFLNRSITVSVL